MSDYVVIKIEDIQNWIGEDIDEKCPKCGEFNTLRWTFSKCCSSKIKSKNGSRYCGKCESKI